MFELLAAAPKLFELGQSIYETVTGKPSKAATAPQLQAEVAALPVDQQKSWADQMQLKIDEYKAETDRLVTEEGEMTPAMMTAIGPEAAKEVALLRMTTRPKVVLRMTHVVMLPFYVTLYDMAVLVANDFIKVGANLFGGRKVIAEFTTLASSFFTEDSLYFKLYEQASWPCVAVVMTYMTLRQFDKAGTSPTEAVSTLIGSVKGLFSKKR